MEDLLKKINGNLIEIKSNQNKETFHISGGTGNIGQQINVFNTSSKSSLYLNQYKYKEYFINHEYSSLETLGEKEGYFILDFYFYFLSVFPKNSNFDKTLSEYIFTYQNTMLKKQNIENNVSDIDTYYKTLDNDMYYSKEDYIKEIINISQTKFEIINEKLSFIKNLDIDLLYFIKYITETKLELFINSNDDELLLHAIGFLFYSNNNLYINENLLPHHFDDYYSYRDISEYNIKKVREIYYIIIENEELRNISMIEYIIKNNDKLEKLKQYKKIKNFFKEIGLDVINIYEKDETIKIGYEIMHKDMIDLIIDGNKLNRLNELIDTFENKKLDLKNKIEDEIKYNLFIHSEKCSIIEIIFDLLNLEENTI